MANKAYELRLEFRSKYDAEQVHDYPFQEIDGQFKEHILYNEVTKNGNGRSVLELVVMVPDKSYLANLFPYIEPEKILITDISHAKLSFATKTYSLDSLDKLSAELEERCDVDVIHNRNFVIVPNHINDYLPRILSKFNIGYMEGVMSGDIIPVLLIRNLAKDGLIKVNNRKIKFDKLDVSFT